MNCSRFRFLIQQWFDTPLSPQDERMVMAHLETCDSCARFQHQLDQVIQSTLEVPLPDECLPSNLEALAKRIMVEIPQQKTGFLSMLKNLLPSFGKGQPKKEKQQQQQSREAAGDGPANGGFPHVRRKPLEDQQDSPAAVRRKQANSTAEEDLLATSTRLKSLQKLQPMSEDPQAMTSSRLGHKFGVNLPERDTNNNLNDPNANVNVNLAESIRRKMVVEKQPDWSSNSDPQDFRDIGEPAQGFGQPAQPHSFDAPPPGFGQAPPPGFGPQGSGMVGQWADSANAPAPTPQTPGWADPPTPGVGGDNDWRPTPPAADWQAGKAQPGDWSGAPQQQQQQQPGPGENWGSAWPDELQSSSSELQNQSQRGGNPAQGLGQPGENWEGEARAQAAWNQPATAAQAQSGQQGAWNGASSAPRQDSGWGAPQQQPPQPTSAAGWADPVPVVNSNDGWGAPPAPAPAAVNANDGWGAPPAPAPAAVNANDGWGAPPAPAPAAVNANDGWGAPPASASAAVNANDGWGAPPAPAPAAVNANDGWGAPPAPAAAAVNANDGWGAPPAPAAAAVNANDGWGAPPAQVASANDGWAAAALPTASNNAGRSGPAQPPDNGWGNPAQPPAAASVPDTGWSAAPKQDWSQQASASQPGWGAPPVPAPSGDGGWGTPSQAPQAPQAAGWPVPQPAPANGANPFLTATPAPAAPKSGAPQQDADAWSEEGEQIQTGMWQAFTLDEPALGTPKGLNQSTARPAVNLQDSGQATDNSRWDTPVQQRAPEPESPNRWDAPISERNKMPVPQAQPPQQQPTPWEQPQPMAAAAPVAEGENKNTIMDRLNTILGEDLTAMAAGPNAPTAGDGPPQPHQPAPWSAPPVLQMGQPAVVAPEPPKADMSQFDIPIQERMRQQPAPTPTAAAGLLKIDDQVIDKVFNELGIKEPSSAGVAPVAPKMVPPPPVLPMSSVGRGQPGQSYAPPMPPAPPMGGAPLPSPARPAVPPPMAPPVGGPRISAVPPRPGVAPVPGPQIPAPNPSLPTPTPNVAPAAAASDPNGMFNKLDDKAMDKIFSNLGVNDAPVGGQQASVQQAPRAPMQAPVAPPAPVPSSGRQIPPPVPQVGAPPQQGGWSAAQPPPAPTAAPIPTPAAPTAAATQANRAANGLFNVDDATMDRIFNDLGVKEKAAAVPKINVREAVNQIRTLAEIPAPKVEGVGRLSREEVAVESSTGKINAIGKFLLDQSDYQKISNLTQADLSDGKVRVLTHEASDEINKLLEHIATQPGVVGSVIVGHDGILIANSLPKELDPETIGILSLGIYVNTTNIAKKIGHNHLHQLVSRTHHGYLVIADFGGGILVTCSNGQETDKLIPLMRSITQLVAQTAGG